MAVHNYVIVGGSHGIGLGLVQRLSAAGHAVTVLSRTAGQLAGLADVKHVAVDVTVDEINEGMFPESIDGLAYCPGSINLRSFRGLKLETFRDDFELNVIGAIKCLQAALPGLKEADSSNVVDVQHRRGGAGDVDACLGRHRQRSDRGTDAIACC